MISLIFIFLILYLVLSLRRLDWAVMFLIAALPSYLIRFDIFGLPSTLLEGMILVVFSAWFVKNFKSIIANLQRKIFGQGGESQTRYPFDVEIILLLLVALFSVGVGGFSDAAFGIWKAYFFEPILFYIVFFNVFIKNLSNKDGGRIEKLVLWPLLVSASVISALAIYQKITGQFIDNPFWAAESTRRVVSFFGYPNAVGLYLAPLVLLFLGYLKTVMARSACLPAGRKQRGKLIFRIMNHELRSKDFFIVLVIILSVLSIFFAKSVGASLGVLAGLIIFGLFANKKSRIATMAILVIMSVIIFSIQPIKQIAYKFLTLNDFSGQVRRIGWSDTWQMLSDGRLIFGAGLSGFQNAIKPYHAEGFFYNKDDDSEFHRKTVFNEEYKKAHWQPLEIYLYPHNIFLNFWTELGLTGMLLFVWIIGKFYYLGMKSLKENKKVGKQENNYLILGLMGAMTVIVAHGLVDVPYFKNDLAIMFWMLLAIMGALSLENKKILTNLK